MRITNNMITRNTKTNINSNKVLVDRYNTQMTTQKKISKASENPVIAIRSLRLSTNLSHVNQYLDNNIPDADAWMDITETALTNMKNILTDIRTQCVNGSTDTMTSEDRKALLQDIQALTEQFYMEGNSDYAGKTVFTGYRSSSNLTFDEDEGDVVYTISQSFAASEFEEKSYYTGSVVVPEVITDTVTECETEIAENPYKRLRLAYNGDVEINSLSYTIGETTTTLVAADGGVASNVQIFSSEEEWEKATGSKTVGDDNIVFVQGTGELIFGADISNKLSDGLATFDVDYTKTGFSKGELRPEYYYDCIDKTDDDPANHVEYTKQNQEISYTIANATKLTINTQASEVFDTSIARDVEELSNAIERAIRASDKVTEIEEMMNEAQYQNDEDQAILQTYLDAAKKEVSFAEDNLQKTYEKYITRFDGYLESVNTAITNVGSTKSRLLLTQTRVENQQTTIEQLKSSNEDRDISDIIIDYYAAYNAYQGSLTAASKIGQTSLLDYI